MLNPIIPWIRWGPTIIPIIRLLLIPRIRPIIPWISHLGQRQVGAGARHLPRLREHAGHPSSHRKKRDTPWTNVGKISGKKYTKKHNGKTKLKLGITGLRKLSMSEDDRRTWWKHTKMIGTNWYCAQTMQSGQTPERKLTWCGSSSM